MASSGIKQAVKEAKALKKKYPDRYKHLKKKDRWSKGYMKQAFAIVNKEHPKRKPLGKPRRKVGAPKKKRAVKRTKARKRTTKGLKLVKAVNKTTSEQVLAGKRRRKRSRRRVGSIGRAPRRRSVGRRGSNTGLLVGLGLGALALILLTNKQQPTGTYQGVQLPPLQQTGNYTRDNKAQELISYAAAAGLAVDAIIKLIDRLNMSNDNEVSNIYDHVNTTGDVGAWV